MVVTDLLFGWRENEGERGTDMKKTNIYKMFPKAQSFNFSICFFFHLRSSVLIYHFDGQNFEF